MACEPGIEPKRPYVQPHDLIYAQPVHIKPVGRPIPAVPVRGPPVHHIGGYGPPKPVPFPPVPGPIIPPHRLPRPLPGPIYAPKPLSPPVYESIEPDLHDYHPHPPVKKPVEVVVNSQGGVQQHVHHHYHHGDVYGSAPLGPGSSLGGGPIGTGSLYGGGPIGGAVYGGSGPYLGQSPFYKKQLSIKTPLTGNGLGSTASSSNYADRYPIYENPRADGVRGLADCFCVPYDQCLPHEVSRKEDGFYIDPRTNGGKNIEAITLDDVVITDGNGTIISRHAKRENDDSKEYVVVESEDAEKIESRDEGKTDDKKQEEDVTGEDKNTRRKRREVAASKDNDGSDSKKSDVQPNTFFMLPLVVQVKDDIIKEGKEQKDDELDENEKRKQRNTELQKLLRIFGDASKYKLSPTFGVSFGLPHGGGGGGYPLNPYGPYPALNPYGSSVGGLGGVNLGLVSVNPLLSVQVTQDEYGDKIVKPLVNLHVTPNHGLVHKLGSILHGFHHKPYYQGYPPFKHDHHHHHIHSSKPYPSYYHPYKPYYHGGPYKPSYHYAPGYHGYRPHDEYIGASSGYVYDEDRYDNGDYYVDDPYSRNSRGNGTANALPSTSSSSGTGSSTKVQFPSDRRSGVSTRTKRHFNHDTARHNEVNHVQERQAIYGGRCGPRYVCCRRPLQPNRPPYPQRGHQCGTRYAQGINGRIKNPVYVDGDSEFGEYPWQAAILKKDVQESVYVCGGTLIDNLHVITAAHCVKTYNGHDLRVRLGEWDVNHDVEFYPYEERDVYAVHIHPEFYAGTLYNDIAVLRLTQPVDTARSPHIAPACLPDPHSDYTGSRCWTTGWGKDAFGDYGKYQNILKEVDVPIVSHQQCQLQLQQTRLGYDYRLHPGMICAGGEEGKDACKGDGGGPMVCERGGSWQLVGIVSWGIGCGQQGVPGVYVKVAHYLDWIRHIVNNRY
ncbi:hypothetical protein B7P43_G14886 [Cryptotermes secundus]|uniref:Phenoloxidase-activating factor 2 n=1 Tax=Cryptotermes secundus TaxID=105785 RepID=A0A2J7RR00_9NEOP|nr:hypothetical protein B7P43_G14886 [Cryptotermes secundus]